MNSDEKKIFSSISCRLLYGTAQMFFDRSAIPKDKKEKEAFLVNTLVKQLPTMSSKVRDVVTNADDSNGQHDVLIIMHDGNHIGVQVTELTSEIRRNCEHKRRLYIRRILSLIQKENINFGERVLASLLFMTSESDCKNLTKKKSLKHIAEAIRDAKVGDSPSLVNLGNCQLLLFLMPIEKSHFYVPNVNDIGVDINFNVVTRSISDYKQAIDCILDKKANSLSPWLLIWSTDFWLDKNWLGNDILEHMKRIFVESDFTNVYFVETLESNELFDANLVVHTIK